MISRSRIGTGWVPSRSSRTGRYRPASCRARAAATATRSMGLARVPGRAREPSTTANWVAPRAKNAMLCQGPVGGVSPDGDAEGDCGDDDADARDAWPQAGAEHGLAAGSRRGVGVDGPGLARL